MSQPGTNEQTLAAVSVETPLGWCGVALSDKGIRRATLFLPSRDAVETALRRDGATPCADGRSGELVERIHAYVGGNPAALQDFPVDLDGHTELQQRVWLALREIPPGETRSYAWLAQHVGLGRGAARAVGTINGDNPIPLWLPCHRVIASDGTLGGFAGGLAMKMQLLELEGALPRRLVG